MDSLIPYPFQLESGKTIDLSKYDWITDSLHALGDGGVQLRGCSVIIASSQAVGTIKRNPIWKVNTGVSCGCISDPCTPRVTAESRDCVSHSGKGCCCG
jgi:hypothetical protein